MIGLYFCRLYTLMRHWIGLGLIQLIQWLLHSSLYKVFLIMLVTWANLPEVD